MKKGSVVFGFAVALILLCSGRLVPASVQELRAEISVDDPRPLAQAILAFEARYGYLVTYEDPRFTHDEDLSDVTEKVRRSPASAGSVSRILIPRGGPLLVRFTAPAARDEAAAGYAVRELVSDYNVSGYPGQFLVLASAKAWHVIPSEIRGADGLLAKQTSILDVRLALAPRKGRTVLGAVEEVLQVVAERTGHQVGAGTVPINAMLGSLMEEGSPESSARDLLVRILGNTGRGLSWQLFYAADLKKYVFNVHSVNEALP